MEIEYDVAKDAANRAKHGIALGRAAEMEQTVAIADPRFDEPRYRLYGLIDGLPYCAAVTWREQRLRIISLRRARTKEYRRHVRPA
ncbi:BrnT family toxin [Sphingomonas sp. RRHST34]|uniref:BrnT family toxin n=1 Tax=Sphingomonas citri TaxID=2862499 RepID=A0ABS7BQF1_9SPHN|nr:BrnT family toxin [Sphingomonas citri]